MNTPARQRLPQILFTKQAVRQFANLFEPRLGMHEAKRALVRLSTRTRTLLAGEGNRSVMALAPDGADFVFIAKKMPGLDSLVCTRVVFAEQDESDEDEPQGKVA